MNRKTLWIFRVSLFLNLAFILAGLFAIIKFNLKLPVPNADRKHYTVVMFGNSLIAGGNWAKLLERNDVLNSGTGGFNTSQMVFYTKRDVLKHHPKICFLGGAINDLGIGIPMKRTLENYNVIIAKLKANKIEPVIESTFYVNGRDEILYNALVDSINVELKNIALKHGITFMNTNQYLVENGRLKTAYTTDGIHLRPAAYQIWAKEVNRVLKEKGI